jgi:hypothetical protein
LLADGYIYSLSDACPLQQKLAISNLDSAPTYEWRWDAGIYKVNGCPVLRVQG